MINLTLTGVRVLDLTSYIAGPYAGALLGDLGADIVKVESPEGDTLRHYPSTLPVESRAYLGVNRNKRGIVIDLKKPAGRQLLERMVRKADVLLHNFRPDAAQRLGLNFSALSAMHPRIVVGGLTGFGQVGPMRLRPGFDQVLQSMTGLSDCQGADEGQPRVIWGSVVDYYAAALLAMSVCAALFARDRTGQAQEIDVSLLRAAIAMQAGRMVWAQGEGRDVPRDLRSGRLAGIHPTREGWLYLQAQTPKFWQALCKLTGLDALAADPRFATMTQRKQHEDEIVAQLHEALSRRTALEWEALFGDRVPCAAVRTVGEMFEHPQVQALGLVATHEHPTLGQYRVLAGAVRIGPEGPTGIGRRAPQQGEHTDELLREWGCSPEEIEHLHAQGVVFGQP
ncbi:MAG: CoA transferase [Acidovorax soli]|uniref:CaiB/BaiF CoA transferase family protein n=1 Tax=Acidovorax soli TaxID=592050 RepID=UPI0026EFC4C9|nr:CoA transferase [Acidovorax soli]MCM2346873.1 CoA transferase [Acidovorax soli]